MHFYNEWALRILHGEWTDHQAFYGLPLYPFLLAALYWIFGFSAFIPGFVQALLEGGTAALIFMTGVRVFGLNGSSETDAEALWERIAQHRGEIIGGLAAFGWAFFGPAQTYSVILMPTSWLVFTFWFVVWQVVKRETMPRLAWAAGLGILIGFAAMGIATVLFLLPLIAAALLFKFRLPDGHVGLWSPRVAAVTVLLTGLFVGAAPSWIHNYFVARDPVFLSAHSGVNYWIGNNPSATGYPRFPPGLRTSQRAMLLDSIAGAERAAGRPLKRSEVSKYWSRQAKDYIRQHPGGWLRLIGTKIANFWNAFQYDDLSIVTTLREQQITLPGLSFGFVAALALPGMVFGVWRFPASRWIAAAILLHMASLLMVFVTERYRIAAVPGLLLFAALMLWELWSGAVEARYKQVTACLAAIFAAAWLVSIPQRNPALWALDSYNSGLQALESNKFDVAQQKLALAYAYVPGNAEINFALGNLRFAQGDKSAARSYYLATLDLDPHHEGSYNNLGVLALEEKNWALAAKFFGNALAQDPNNAKSHFLLASAYLGGGDLENARVELERALALNPQQPEFLALKRELEAKLRPH